MSTEQQAVERVLSHPSSVQVHGERPLAKRRLGDRFRQLVKTGVLSAVLLAQAAQIAHAGPLIEHMTQPQQEGPAAVQMVQAGAEQAAFEVEVFNPMEHVDIPDVMAEGGISGTSVISHWWSNGIQDLQVLQLTHLMVMGQSPTIVASEQAKQSAMDLAKRTEGIFSVSSQKEAVEFLSQNALGLLENEGVFLPGTEQLNIPDPHQAVTVNTVMDYWEAYGAMAHGDPPPLYAEDNYTAADLNEAMGALKQAVSEAGLNSLRIPLPMWTSPTHLKQVADNLTQANTHMQALTGWEGEVLGLKGNVDLTIGSPSNMAFAGINSSGNVEVLADFDMLVHEVLGHGVSLLIAKQAGYTPGAEGGAPLFGRALEHQPDTIPASHAHLADAWSGLKEGVSQAMDGWEARFADHEGVVSGKLELSYFSTSWEKIAYSLEGVAMKKLGADSVLTNQGNTRRNFFPSAQETIAAAPVWEQTFDTLNQSWWSKMPSAQMQIDAGQDLAAAPAVPSPEPAPAHLEVSFPSMSQWRQARATQATAPAPQVAVSSQPALGR